MSRLLFPVYSPGIRRAGQGWPQYCYRIKIKSSRRPRPRVLSLKRMINMWEAGGTFLLRSHETSNEPALTKWPAPDWMSLEILNHRQRAALEWHHEVEMFRPDLSWLWSLCWPDPRNGVKLGQKTPALDPPWPSLIPPGSPRPVTRARSRRLRCQFSLIKHHKMRQKNERLNLQQTVCTAFIFTASARGINILKWSLSFLQLLILTNCSHSWGLKAIIF